MTFTALVPSVLPTARVHLAPLGSWPYAFFREPQNLSLSEIVETAMTYILCPPLKRGIGADVAGHDMRLFGAGTLALPRLIVTPDPGHAILYSLLVAANVQNLLLYRQANSLYLSD